MAGPKCSSGNIPSMKGVKSRFIYGQKGLSKKTKTDTLHNNLKKRNKGPDAECISGWLFFLWSCP